MKENKKYQKLLNKMLMIENAGEILYKALISKTKDNNLKSIYGKLAQNEYEAAKYIEKEISSTNKNLILYNRTILKLIKIICNTLTAKQLAYILQRILKERIYSAWYAKHKDSNPDFWLLLLNHENLQHKLLEPLFNNQKGGV